MCTKRQKYASIFLMMLTKACFKSLCAWKVGDFLRSFSEYMVCFGRFDRSSGSEKLRLGDLDPTTRGHQYLSEQNFRETSSCPLFIFLIKCTHWILKLCHTCYELCVTCNKLPIGMVTTKLCKNCKCCPWSRFFSGASSDEVKVSKSFLQTC